MISTVRWPIYTSACPDTVPYPNPIPLIVPQCYIHLRRVFTFCVCQIIWWVWFRDMRRNPINLILTGIAVADLLMMLEYIPFAAHMYLLKYQGSRWIPFVTMFSNLFHGQDPRGGVFACLGPFHAFPQQLLNPHSHSVNLVHTSGGANLSNMKSTADCFFAFFANLIFADYLFWSNFYIYPACKILNLKI